MSAEIFPREVYVAEINLIFIGDEKSMARLLKIGGGGEKSQRIYNQTQAF